MADVKVHLAGRSYMVRVDDGLLDDTVVQAGEFIERYHAGGYDSRRKIPFVTDQNAFAHHGEIVAHSLASDGYEIDWFITEPGEGAKSWEVLQELIDWLLERGVERGDTIFALGGGVIGDLTGFAASILKRGCKFVQLPTTLLAQVDSSVGGKTAINVAAGKNLVGAFHQPSLVLADTSALRTLPLRELRCGYAEVIKYGILGDADFFAWCEENGAKVLDHDREAVKYAVTSSIAAKARIVAEDERETSGARALLNLGHTFGHALEAETGYSDRLLHGEAVAMGMVLAARYSAQRGFLSENDAARITSAIAAAGLATEISSLGMTCDGQALADHMLHDKKMDGGTLPFILLRGIGDAFLDREVSLSDVAAFLSEQLAAA
ncbi:3-dehydroquinate synthase [Aurantiacibacter marinus]|uniref:3-dehydroquinate synthase n=1 Tax=Aurantiacibacter marinus TaxID=874156 RepID=A0A0H0XKD0_9SPHN|nr:3-dehydroquinate synthase [Aurantiacibacter marinus]KLI63068.1 3-dehydroquinate synthase [Aurantiacibacter marinus]